MDIFEVEKRGMFSPPNGNSPQVIPDSWKNSPDEELLTNLWQLSDEELNSLGWKGPIQMPPLPGTSLYTHSFEWNTQTREYDVIEFDESEKKKRVDYQKFWDELIVTSAYATIKITSSQSLSANTIATEFIALLSDAKNGYANVEKIQEVLLEFIANIPFTEEELQEIQRAFTESGMFAVYTLS